MIYDYIILFFGTMGISILFHEAGHALMLYIYTKEFPKISFENFKIFIGSEKQIESLTKDQKIVTYFSGILLGLYPLIHLALFFNILILIFIPLYFLGCKIDIKNIYRSVRYG